MYRGCSGQFVCNIPDYILNSPEDAVFKALRIE